MARTGAQPGPRLRNLVDRISGALGIPPEIVLDVPKATLIGSLQVQVENHRGVLEYTSRRVRIRSRAGEIVITGSRLRIGSIYQQEMVIEGQITGVELPQGGKAS